VDNTTIGAIVVIAIILLAFWGMFRSWRRRSAVSATTRASSTVSTTTPTTAENLTGQSAEPTVTFSVLYVATTPTDSPLQRLNLPGLGFRAKTKIQVLPDVIEIAPAGEVSTLISPASFLGVRSARVAIDRVVEKDGLTALDWVATDTLTGTRSLVTSYFRIPNIRTRESLEATLTAFGVTHSATVKEVAS
jgi:hypothetical protein